MTDIYYRPDGTSDYPLLEPIIEKYDCKLLHSQVPNGIDLETREIIWKCKEGCND